MHFKKLSLTLLAAQFIPGGKGLLKGYRKSGMKMERRTVGRTYMAERERKCFHSICMQNPSHSLANLKWPGIFFFLNIALLKTWDSREKNNHLIHIPISLYFPPLFLYINIEILKINIHTKQSNILPTEENPMPFQWNKIWILVNKMLNTNSEPEMTSCWKEI